ncbi:38248_t:CDS:1, partial [Gigaspora margarita]
KILFGLLKVYSPSKGTDERKQLHEDYLKDFSELCQVFGIQE